MRYVGTWLCKYHKGIEVVEIPCHCVRPREKIMVKCGQCGEVEAKRCNRQCAYFETKITEEKK